MARKKKEEKVEKAVKEEPKVVPPARKLQGHPIADVSWKPEPKGTQEAPSLAEASCQNMVNPYDKCNHQKKMHYGGAKGYCNTSGCLCQEFK